MSHDTLCVCGHQCCDHSHGAEKCGACSCTSFEAAPALTAVPMEGEATEAIVELRQLTDAAVAAVAGEPLAEHYGKYYSKAAMLISRLDRENRNLQSALAKANGELTEARAALARIANAPGSSVWHGEEELRRQLQAIHDYARAALHPNSEGQNR